MKIGGDIAVKGVTLILIIAICGDVVVKVLTDRAAFLNAIILFFPLSAHVGTDAILAKRNDQADIKEIVIAAGAALVLGITIAHGMLPVYGQRGTPETFTPGSHQIA